MQNVIKNKFSVFIGMQCANIYSHAAFLKVLIHVLYFALSSLIMLSPAHALVCYSVTIPTKSCTNTYA